MIISPFARDVIRAFKEFNLDWHFARYSAIYILSLNLHIYTRSFEQLDFELNNTPYEFSFLEKILIWNEIKILFRYSQYVDKNTYFQ
jgi:hypothetical protein